MRTRLVRIGRSRGVCIPEDLLRQAEIDGEVELRVADGGLVVTPVRSPRAGWAEAARLVRARGEDGMPDPPTPTRFERAEWEWK